MAYGRRADTGRQLGCRMDLREALDIQCVLRHVEPVEPRDPCSTTGQSHRALRPSSSPTMPATQSTAARSSTARPPMRGTGSVDWDNAQIRWGLRRGQRAGRRHGAHQGLRHGDGLCAHGQFLRGRHRLQRYREY